MNGQVFISDLLILSILIPTLIYALLPLKSFFRFSVKKTISIGLPAIALVIVVIALIGANAAGSGETGAAVAGTSAGGLGARGEAAPIHFKWFIVLGLIPALALHMLLVDAKISMRLYCFFNSTMIAGNGILYGMILAAPIEKDGTYITVTPLTALICIGITIALGVIYYKSLSKKIAYLISSESININYAFAIGVTLFISVLFFWVMPNYASVIMTGRVRVTILAFLLLGPGAFQLVYHAMWRVAVNLTENAELRESNELMAMEQKRYEELRAYMNETRRLRHDFRQHLLVIDEYASQGEADKIKDYIGQFTESLKDHRSEIAANRVLDAVAAHYESVAETQSTHIKWLIELPAELPLREADFITVFGNLLENAIRAVGELPESERSIQVNARMLSDAMLGITVKNPYKGTITFGKDGLPKTTKPGRGEKSRREKYRKGMEGTDPNGAARYDRLSDCNGHGIGLHSVKVVASRYNGAVDIDTKDGVFSIGVLLYV